MKLPSDAIFKAVVDDTRIIPFNTSPARAFALLSAMQLATRHPEMGDDLRYMLIDMAVHIQEALSDLHPGLVEVMDAGWHEEYDVLGGE